MGRSLEHYKIPNGNTLISFSGGRTSGYMLHQILEANQGLPDKAKVVFANTGREMPETLDFVQECADRWNVQITWLEYTRINNRVNYKVVNHNNAARNGEPLEELFLSRSYLPNVVSRFCTAEAKVRTIKRYLVTELKWKKWFSCIGIRADEARRIKTESKDRWTFWYPLYEDNITKKEIMEFWNKQPFNLNLVGPNGVTPKGNCDGCFLKSEATLAMMWREHPERMQWWADMEDKIGSSFHKKRTFKEIGDFVQKQGDWIFDDEAFLCQADDGECTG